MARCVLSDLITEFLTQSSGPLQAKHLTVHTNFFALADQLPADRDQIAEVLLNVIDSAINVSLVGAAIDITMKEVLSS